MVGDIFKAWLASKIIGQLLVPLLVLIGIIVLLVWAL
jgi:hypothetical protein